MGRESWGLLFWVPLMAGADADAVVAWERGLEGWEMTESQVVNRWIGETEVKATLAAFRLALIRILCSRFGEPIPDEVLETINTQPSATLLVDWIDAASLATTLQDFIAVLRR